MREYFTAVSEAPNHPPCPPHPALEAVAKMIEERAVLMEKLEMYNRQIAQLHKMLEGL